jgi:hypothetical protein
MPQIVYYHPGAGTEASKVADVLGGAFGVGVAQDIAESYRFICDNYSPGDEIVIIGFSRGAFTARSVAAMVCALGFLNRSGLDQLPYIFYDYETWQDWHKKPFDGKKHLVGLTLENLKKLNRFKAAKDRGQSGATKSPQRVSDKDLEQDLAKKRKRIYDEMALMKRPDRTPDLRAMAIAYRKVLQEASPPTPSCTSAANALIGSANPYAVPTVDVFASAHRQHQRL